MQIQFIFLIRIPVKAAPVQVMPHVKPVSLQMDIDAFVHKDTREITAKQVHYHNYDTLSINTE